MSALHYATPLIGLNMFVRQHGLAFFYDISNWTPPADGSWHTYHHGYDQFRRDGFLRHVVCAEKDRLVVMQMLPTAPNWNRAVQLSRLALGPRAGDSLVDVRLFPLSIRVPMTASAEWLASLPETGFRAMRILPSEKAAPQTAYLLGSEAELRVSASRVRGRVRIYGEIFPNGLHRKFEGEVRRMLLPPDARCAQSMMYGVDVSRSSIAGSLRELLEFVAKVRDLGFEVKTKTRLPGGHIGTVVERDGAAYLDVKMPALYDVPPFTMSLGALRPTEGQNADAK